MVKGVEGEPGGAEGGGCCGEAVDAGAGCWEAAGDEVDADWEEGWNGGWWRLCEECEIRRGR